MYKLLKNNYKGGPGSGPRAGNKRGPYKKKEKINNEKPILQQRNFTAEKQNIVSNSISASEIASLITKFSQEELLETFNDIQIVYNSMEGTSRANRHNIKMITSHLNADNQKKLFNSILEKSERELVYGDQMAMRALCEFAETQDLKIELSNKYKASGLDYSFENPAIPKPYTDQVEEAIREWKNGSTDRRSLWVQAAISQDILKDKDTYNYHPDFIGIKYQGVATEYRIAVRDIYAKTQNFYQKTRKNYLK